MIPQEADQTHIEYGFPVLYPVSMDALVPRVFLEFEKYSSEYPGPVLSNFVLSYAKIGWATFLIINNNNNMALINNWK